MEENHSGQAIVSKYPVQRGFLIANHLIRQNRVINVRAYIPEVLLGGIDPNGAEAGILLDSVASKFGLDSGGILPIAGGILADPYGTLTNYLDGAVGAIAPVVGTIASAVDTTLGWFTEEPPFTLGGKEGIVGQFLPKASRRINAFEMVQHIQENGLLCSLNTALKEYSDLVLINYNIPTNSETYSVIYLDLTFEQVKYVDALGKVDASITNSELDAKEKRDARISATKMHQTVGSSYLTEAVDKLDFLDGLIA